MKHSLFWVAVEAAAKATRSGLSVVGALVDCGIPRQHAGEQWLEAFEEENECLEVPLSADFTDGAAAYFCNQCGPREQEDVDHCNYLRCRVVESQAIAQQLQESVFRSSGQTKQYGPRPRISTVTPQDSRTNAGATSSRAVEEGLTEGARPPAAPFVSAAIPYRGEQLSWCEYVQPAIDALLADHIYEFGFLTNCTCGSTGIFDWRDWRDHIGPLLAERLEAVTLALPEM